MDVWGNSLPRDNREAWRHLLSAAFGLPEDGMINRLARVYEADGKQNVRSAGTFRLLSNRKQ